MKLVSVNCELINQGFQKIFEDLPGLVYVYTTDVNYIITNTSPSIYVIGLSKVDDALLRYLHEQNISYVVLLDSKYDRHHVNKLIKSSVRGFLTLENKKEEIIKCVESVQLGKPHFPREISNLFLIDTIKLNQFKLSDREYEILELLSAGKTLQEISEALYLSKNTVITHKRNILKKTGLNKMTQLIAWWTNGNI